MNTNGSWLQGKPCGNWDLDSSLGIPGVGPGCESFNPNAFILPQASLLLEALCRLLSQITLAWVSRMTLSNALKAAAPPSKSWIPDTGEDFG